ncbi:MAG: hypothetical protein KDA61_04155 [Planctomycetales bacterium]|nr:hypothetical protein [Planctomycetales bacterium]
MENVPPGPGEASVESTNDSSHALPMVLALVVVAIAAGLWGLRGQPLRSHDATLSSVVPTAPPHGSMELGAVVGLTIDFGNEIRREYDAIPWQEGMTVGDAMDQARLQRPAIQFSEVGQADQSLLISLEGVAGEGGGGRNWLYAVDGKHGETSFRVHPLRAGERILWQFRQGE